MRSNSEQPRSSRHFWPALAVFALGVSVPLMVSALRLPPPAENSPAPLARAQDTVRPPSRDRRTPVVVAAERASPAVVAIEVGRETQRFFRRRGVRGEGSGVFINSRGYLLTNFHVVRSAHAIHVHRTDGRSFPADMVAHGEASDIAVLRVRAPGEEAEDLDGPRLREELLGLTGHVRGEQEPEAAADPAVEQVQLPVGSESP